MDCYKETLVKAIDQLIQIRGEIFDVTIEIAMQGELKEWCGSVPVGETVNFTKELLEGCTDNNIQLMAKLITYVENTCNSICNINNIPFPKDV